ncbi:MAG: glycine--tRNA ligase subunit beta, partial [bacterium]|nr:glycine--tRNA ligase subunit beta [bacterium]
CEIPGVVAGAFDPEYLALPGEVTLATLQQQQSAFVLSSVSEEGRGELLPYFVTVMDRPDDPQGVVRAGQERAAAGRLNDALFHYEADRRLPLAERSRRLDQLSFHSRLGSFAHKARRVRALVELIAGELGWHDDLDPACEAAVLLKTDLTTAMVRDFGSLRGIMGGIYAREEGYVEAVWQAIYDQYKPASLDESIPRGRSGQLVAVADRLDALVGFFGIGQAPTGSKDPLAMRRRALGLLRILIEAEMPLDLDLIAARAVLLYNDGREGEGLERGAEEILQALQGFLADRLRNLLGQRGFAHDEIEAAMAVGANNLPDLAARLRALRTMREASEFRSLVLAAKRIFNIVKESPEFELHPELLVEEAEKDLYANLVEVRRTVDEAADRRRYEDCLLHMEALVPSLDRFFAKVLVMDEDETLRHNRMALLQATRRVFWRMARLKEMAIDKADIPSLADTRVLKPMDLKMLAKKAAESREPEA